MGYAKFICNECKRNGLKGVWYRRMGLVNDADDVDDEICPMDQQTMTCVRLNKGAPRYG